MRFIVVTTASAAFLAIASLGLAAGSASAAVTSSRITSPDDPSFFQVDPNNAVRTEITVTGTTTYTGTPGKVDLQCANAGASSTHFANDVPVDPDGAFSFTGDVFDRQMCVLRAVPAGTTPPRGATFAEGPRVGFGNYSTNTVTSGTNNIGKVYDFLTLASQLQGYADYVGVGDGGVYDAYPLDPSNDYTAGADLFYGNATLKQEGTRSQIRVDGVDAYSAYQAQSINGDNPGLPRLSFSRTLDPATGNLTVRESESIVKCAPQAATYPPTSTSCTSFVPTGVRFTRTIVQDHDGRQARVTDTFTSTDGAQHALDLRYGQGFEKPTAGFRFPWVDGTTYKTHASGDTIGPAPSSPATVFVAHDNTKADGDKTEAQGAITFAEAPSSQVFVAGDPIGNPTSNPPAQPTPPTFVATYTRTVPAGGQVSLRQAFSWAFTKADAATLANQAEALYSPPPPPPPPPEPQPQPQLPGPTSPGMPGGSPKPTGPKPAAGKGRSGLGYSTRCSRPGKAKVVCLTSIQVLLAKGTSRQACSGTVRVGVRVQRLVTVVRHGRKRRVLRTSSLSYGKKLGSDCRVTGRADLTRLGLRGHPRVKVHFLGNDLVRGVTSGYKRAS